LQKIDHENPLGPAAGRRPVDKELADLLTALRAKEQPRRARRRLCRYFGWPTWALVAMVGGSLAFMPWWFLPAWIVVACGTAVLFVGCVRVGRRSWPPKPDTKEVPHADTGR
jgi:hypothetical protein